MKFILFITFFCFKDINKSWMIIEDLWQLNYSIIIINFFLQFLIAKLLTFVYVQNTSSYRKFMHVRIVLIVPFTASKGSLKLLLERSFVLSTLFSFIDYNLDMAFKILYCLFGRQRLFFLPLLLWKLSFLFHLVFCVLINKNNISGDWWKRKYQHEYLWYL